MVTGSNVNKTPLKLERAAPCRELDIPKMAETLTETLT